MSRTSKKGLDYFPMDIDLFNDLKIRKLIKYQGGKAVTVYTLLLCNIYKNGYYMPWDKELPFVCSELTGFEEAYISEVIKTCLTLGLFSKELYDSDKVLTSKGIQQRYYRICSQCRRVCDITAYNLIDNKLTTQHTRKKHKMATEKKPENPAVPQPPKCGYMMTLAKEIEEMKKDECWLDQLQVLHSITKNELRVCMEDFRIQCLADGKEFHQSLQDAKQHFNSWLRIVKNNKKNNNDKDKSNRRNLRKGNVLKADEEKTYGDSF